jgi:predicted RNA-binding protein with PUA-like domain
MPAPIPALDDVIEPASPRCWLMKSEPHDCSIDRLASVAQQTVPWTGVRNYQARNFMRDAMRIGDGVLFYHSSCPQPGIAGLARVASAAYVDASQFDSSSPWHDPKSPRDAPRWLNVDVQFVRKTRLLGLAELRRRTELADLLVLKPGNRLSITPVSAAQWLAVLAALDGAPV